MEGISINFKTIRNVCSHELRWPCTDS